MSISDTSLNHSTVCHRRIVKGVIVSFGFTLFCLVLNAVYTHYSYGVTSTYLQLMFLIPMLGCTMPFVLLLATKQTARVTRVGFNLWNSGLSVYAFGCLIRAIVNISGRFTDYDRYFWYTGSAFLIVALFANTICLFRHRKENA